MNNLRKYGKEPFGIAVIHGGPGAAGEMAPVARELAFGWSILEPLQTAASLEGQVEELKATLEKNSDIPVTLIGFSWGAWLSFIVAANYPAIVKKLILIGSGPYKEKYATEIQEIRLNRLHEREKTEYNSILMTLVNLKVKNKDDLLERLGALALKTDIYYPIEYENEIIDYNADIFKNVWAEASHLRKSGKLLKLAKNIKCPTVAIHGDYDPHPAKGIEKPLSVAIKNFRFISLANCGHKPWIERQAKDDFYKILKEELI